MKETEEKEEYDMCQALREWVKGNAPQNFEVHSLSFVHTIFNLAEQ